MGTSASASRSSSSARRVIVIKAGKVADVLLRKAERLRTNPDQPLKLLISGAPGIGKTSLVNMIARTLASHPVAIEDVNGKEVGLEIAREWTRSLAYRSLFGSWSVKVVNELDRIEEQTGWRPQDACFAPKGWWNPPAIKEHLLKKDVFPIHGEDARHLAIESNPRTREMYARFAIPCYWVTEEGTCLTEGMRIVKRLPP